MYKIQGLNCSFQFWAAAQDTKESSTYLVENESLARQILRKEDLDQYWKARRKVRGCAGAGIPAPYAYRENAGLLVCLLEDIKMGKTPKEKYKTPDYIPYKY